MEPINKTPVYYETAAYARENGELELFRLSHRTNIACKNDIQAAISRHFDGMRLDKETAKEVLDQYGAERVSIVLAATVQYKSCDGRFSFFTAGFWRSRISLRACQMKPSRTAG